MRVLNLEKTALFLDFDGTLVNFAETPEAVLVGDDLRDLLLELHGHLSGALALVSGRSLTSLDELLRLPQLAAAGGHGAEWRLGGGSLVTVDQVDYGPLEQVRARLAPVAAQNALLLEDKGHSLALHFRGRPQVEGTLDALIAAEIAPLPGIRVISGNCVREVQVQGVDKGAAVARFMQKEPFAGLRPCYVGDDTTDEDAFAWVNAQKGVSIKVGGGPTIAQQRLPDVSSVHDFLRNSLSRGRA